MKSNKKYVQREYKQDTDSALSDRARTISHMKQQILLQKNVRLTKKFVHFQKLLKFFKILKSPLYAFDYVFRGETVFQLRDRQRNRNELRTDETI